MQVLFETTEQVAFVTLNCSEKLNALSREMLEELARIFEDIAQDKNLRSVILTGAGTDIGELANLSEKEPKQVSESGQRVCNLIEHCPVPVIAAMDGIVIGYSYKLVLACHLRIASQESEFYLPKTGLGNKRIKANEALRMGLVNRVVPSPDILNEATSIARIISSLAPLAVRACLRAVIDGFNLPLQEGLKLEAELFSELFATEDMHEGTTAFLEKRKPIFQGK